MTGEEHDTEITPTAAAPEMPEAWSVDDEPVQSDVSAARRHGPLVSLGLVALVVGVIGCVILLASVLFGWHDSKHAELSHISSPLTAPTTGVAVPPPAAPPTTMTVQAAPPNTGLPTPAPSVYDQNFISLMTQEGWTCTGLDVSPQVNDPCWKQMVGFAHQICSYSGQPISLIYQNFGLPSFFGPREERTAIANAEQAYPNCAFTGS
jgi:hypothetical protein